MVNADSLQQTIKTNRLALISNSIKARILCWG